MPRDAALSRTTVAPGGGPVNASEFAGLGLASGLHEGSRMERRRRISRTIPDHASRCIENAGLEAYGVLSEIARGGMSTIYLGEDRATGERVAIKALDEYYVGHSDLV